METRAIREQFLAFFEERDHVRVPSSSLIPNDPALLLTNAGMNQFKPYFLGEQTPSFARAMTVQKCFRTVDIDEVGDSSHLTFFEMLGNFSFGDYYKEQACLWAWELLTETFGMDAQQLWVTVYEGDDEAAEIWADVVGVQSERIVRLGKDDNFWSMDVAGPCGPDSEIFFDLGKDYGDPSPLGPAGNEERYVEIWNLVFMENDCDSAIEPVADLPKKNIDTGSGLERLAFVLQGAKTIFDTDTLGVLVAEAASLTGVAPGRDERSDIGLRILADHGRGLTFLAADGVLPSNEGRGYVLRRIMRRAIRQARLLGRDRLVLPRLVEATVRLMGGFYPELVANKDLVLEVAEREEARFSETLSQGLAQLESEIGRASGTRREAKAGARVGGDVAFKLHDTYGFPIDLTVEIASEHGVDIDRAGFESLMEAQRERARRARRTASDAGERSVLAAMLDASGPTEFLGYEHLEGEGELIGLADGAKSVALAAEGQEVDAVFDSTVFYAEGGGQVGDMGTVKTPSGEAKVLDVRRLAPGLTGHRLRVLRGEVRVGDVVAQGVDPVYRSGCQRAHTATHILHWILRDRLGEHATQAGSLVEPGRLRFDFNHFDSLGDGLIADISSELQDRVLSDDTVRAYETSYDFARSLGAMAIFGEKYGDFVRVVEVGDYSKELCGGTHVPHTSQIAVALVTSESSIGANLRRVEALVGRDGLRFLAGRAAVLARSAELLKANPEDVAERVERLLATGKDMERRLAAQDRDAAEFDAQALARAAADVNGVRVLVARRDAPVDALRSLVQTLKSRLGSGVVVLGAAGEGHANLVGGVTKDLVERGVSARELLAAGSETLGGGEGGKPELAISGGPRQEGLDAALEQVREAVLRALEP